MLAENLWLRALEISVPISTLGNLTTKELCIHQVPCKWEGLHLDLKDLLFILPVESLGPKILLASRKPASPAYQLSDLGQATELLCLNSFMLQEEVINLSDTINQVIELLLQGLNDMM